jgi:NADPH-dependent glutamate synthase beta subunit-like oxidoreductase/formate hydrogenlyase subunit 6/NADH:ubiquinone oxidoreductase subunit I
LRMKKVSSPSTVKKAILLVGSGYGALKVAQDIAQSGLPLLWVTKAPHFLEMAAGRSSFTEWPADINFQFRPLYLRVTRHPNVTALTHAHVESIEKVPEGYRIHALQAPPYVDYDLCTGCGRCQSVCPLQESAHSPLTRTPPYCPSRALDLDKRKPSPCRSACPLGVNVQAYMALAAQSRFDEALAVIREDNPLPGICGRVCHHPCEEACRRATVDEAVSICSVKRFLSDRELTAHPPAFPVPDCGKKKERVAIVGSGPAGLTAAHYLLREGFPVTIFESQKEAGGMLRTGINAFRLPRNILDLEIQALVDEGIEIRTGFPVGDLQQLFADGFQAVLLCTGAHHDLRLEIEGEDARGVFGAVEMLRNIYTGGKVNLKGHIVVIGGGNSAIDAARAAIRLGADSVTICYRRERDDMPARIAEIREAEEEGVRFEFRVAPRRIVAEKGRATGIELIRMKMGPPDESGRKRPEAKKGSEFKIPADRIIVAIGQEPHWRDMGIKGRFNADKQGRIQVDNSSTGQPGVFAAGDVVTGPDTVVGSMSQGRLAAGRIIAWIENGCPGMKDKKDKKNKKDIESAQSPASTEDYLKISPDEPHLAREEMPRRDCAVRRRDFEEVETGFTAAQAVHEARRCLQCASCCECRICETVCRDIGAIDHARPSRRVEIISPSIIIANEEEITPKEFLKEENVYRVGDFRHTTDIVNVLMAGSASAGMAMAKGSSLRVSGKPSVPETYTDGVEERLGIFICTCNDTLASVSALERIRDMGQKFPGVVHSGLVFSACHPRGAEMIDRDVRRLGLGRIILASCVCCPLEFQCISCNDQRNRARIHLFDRLGLDRSRFEMVNLRDHLEAPQHSDDQVVAKARDFLREAFIRARFLGPLRSGTTKIGKNILILGGSEVGVSCARILDHQGFKVHLVHRCRLKTQKEMPRDIQLRPVSDIAGYIKHIPEAVIDSIQGHLGDFTVTYEENGKKRYWKADIVCLTDPNVLSLTIPEDLFGLKKFYRYDFAFFHTPQIGIYRVMPRTLTRVSAFQAGTALAAHVTTAAAEAFLKDHELSPRVDPARCRGCGRCVDICPFDAVRLVANDRGFYTAEILRHNCVGCGGCVGRCPVTAMDMPYFSNRLLEEIVACTLTEAYEI